MKKTETSRVICARIMRMTVYVPTNWTNEQIEKFAEIQNPANTGTWYVKDRVKNTNNPTWSNAILGWR